MSMDSIKQLDELLKRAGLGKAAEETQEVVKDPVEAQTNVGKEMTEAEDKGDPSYTQAASSEGENLEYIPKVPANEIPVGGTDEAVDVKANGMKITELMDEPKTAGQKALDNLMKSLSKKAEDAKAAKDEVEIKEVGVEGAPVDSAYNLNDAPPCDKEDTAHPEGPKDDLPAGVKEAAMRNIGKIAASLHGIHKYAAIRSQVHDALSKAASVGEVGKTGLPYPTGCQTLVKFASAMKDPAKQGEFLEYMGAIQKNAAFNQMLQKVAMKKRAEDIEAVMGNQGVDEAQAAAMLDQALAEDPELQQELAAELNGEALGALADAEVDNAALEEAAAEAGVTPEDIEELAGEIQEIADEAGVEPEVIAEQLVTELGGDGSAVAEEVPAEEAAEETKTASRRTF